MDEIADSVVPDAVEPTGDSPPESKDDGEASLDAKPEATKRQPEQKDRYAGTKHKVRVGHLDQEIEYDELIRGYQLNKASHKKFQEASDIRKKVDDLVGSLNSGDHKDFVKIVGKENARKMAEQLLLEEIEYEQLPDHEKTIRRLEAEKKESEREKQEQETKRQTLERQQLEHAAAVEIEGEIVDALKASGSKPSARLIARVAEIMEAHIISTGGKERISATQALEYVTGDIPKDFFSYVSGLSKDQVLKLKKELPKEFLDVLRQDDIDSVPSPFGEGRTSDKIHPPKKSKTSSRRMTTDDWFAKMEKQLGG